jgi:O-antigen/teichoic acid export membrane protein
MSSVNTTPETPIAGRETQKFRTQMGHISRHSGVFFAGTMFTTAAGYFFKVYVARVLGAEALGVYALGMTIIGLVGVFNGLGLPQSAVRFVAMYSATGKSDQLRGFIVRAVGLLLAANILLASLVNIAGPWVALHFYHTPVLKTYLKLFSLIMVLGALTTFFGQVLQGYKDVSRRTVITNFIGTPLTMLLTVALVLLGKGLWGYIFAQVLSAAVVLALLVAVAWNLTPAPARRLMDPLPPVDSQVLSFGAVVFGIGLMEFLLAQADKILIGFYINAREVGIYAVAMAVVAFVPVALQSVNQIFSPTIADLHARGERNLLGRLFQTLTKWILAFTLPLATVVIVFSKPLMRIFGHDFEAGWPILVVGTLGQLVNCGTGSVGYLLLMSGNQKRLIKVQAFMTVMMVVLNILLIPRLGILGAAVAAALTNVGANAWNLREVKASLGLSPYNRSYPHLVFPAIGMLLSTLVFKHIASTVRPEWLVIVSSTVVAYGLFFGLLSTFGLDSDDRLVSQAVWSKLRGSFKKPTVES